MLMPLVNSIHKENGLMAVPLNNSPTIVTLKGITPTMETIKHKERTPMSPTVSESKITFSLSLFLPLLSLNNQCNLPAYFPST